MNIIEAAKALKNRKTVEQNHFQIIPSVADFVNFKCLNMEATQTTLTIDDILSEKWTVLDE